MGESLDLRANDQLSGLTEAQWGRRSSTGSRNLRPCGPHMTRGLRRVSPAQNKIYCVTIYLHYSFPVSGVIQFTCVRRITVYLCQVCYILPVLGVIQFICVRCVTIYLCQVCYILPVSGVLQFTCVRYFKGYLVQCFKVLGTNKIIWLIFRKKPKSWLYTTTNTWPINTR